VVSATSAISTRWSRRLVLQFLAPTLAALAAALAVAVPYIAISVDRHQVDTLAERLLAEARATSDSLPWSHGESLDIACQRLAADLGVRITVIASDGTVLGESARSSESLDNHADRPEVRTALRTGSGQSARISKTVGMRLLYVAWRQQHGAEVRIVRAALPLTTVEANVASLQRLLVAGVGAGAIVGLLVAIVLSRRMLRRIQRLVTFARQVAGGAPAPYLAAERGDDLGLLESQLAEMERALASTIDTLRIEREQMEAILRGMVEGVVLTDLEGRVVLLNARARLLLEVSESAPVAGRPLVEVARDAALQDLIRELRSGQSVVSRDMMLSGGAERTVQVNAARLVDRVHAPLGFVLVLHDVTELRRLEVVRRDFVANVSHELRTPLTAIKGYAETLLGPAGDDRDTARRFLAVIDRHSERLSRLTEDLLALSDLELGHAALHLETVEVQGAVEDVIQMLADRAARGQVWLSRQIVPGTPPLHADSDRIRQVLINLIDNGIKYTGEGGRVVVRAAPVPGRRQVEIAVEDSGVGIPAQDIPRLTERFFRVDKARSRQLGGTGLGLAIVKHIMQAHGGTLDITSTVGQGTTVRVRFPATGEPAALASTAS